MFIFPRKRLLYAYLTEWFKFADLDKINLISSGAKFFRRLLFEHSRFLPFKIFIYVFSRCFASKHERFSLPNYQCYVCLKPTAARTLCFRFNLRLVILRVKSLNFAILAGLSRWKGRSLSLHWLLVKTFHKYEKISPVRVRSQTSSNMNLCFSLSHATE